MEEGTATARSGSQSTSRSQCEEIPVRNFFDLLVCRESKCPYGLCLQPEYTTALASCSPRAVVRLSDFSNGQLLRAILRCAGAELTVGLQAVEIRLNSRSNA